MPDRYAVIGNPVDHSLSPRIHALFAAQRGASIRYDKMTVERGHFAAALATFRRAGGRGANVTAPFKRDAWRSAETRSARAERAGAVNTLLFRDDGLLYGDTTDGVGLLRDLSVNRGVRLAGRRILLLGAGGAARGALLALAAEGPREIRVANRTAERARALAREFAEFADRRTTLYGGGFETIDGAGFDLIVNCVSADLPPALLDGALGGALLEGGATRCYDMVYGRSTPFLEWGARRCGVENRCDGLGMLVEQAAESSLLWHGVRPQTAPVIAALRAT